MKMGAVLVLAVLGLAQARPNDPAAREWIQLFNGRDLADWTVKFAKHDLGENLHNTFRVEDGLLKIRYDRWPSFSGEFGHIFYKDPFSYYLLAAEYRFVGEQVAGGPSWAVRNNGLMLHSPHPRTMLKDQDFPISLEIQLLGGLGTGPRTTANLCTPGSHVVYNGRRADAAKARILADSGIAPGSRCRTSRPTTRCMRSRPSGGSQLSVHYGAAAGPPNAL